MFQVKTLYDLPRTLLQISSNMAITLFKLQFSLVLTLAAIGVSGCSGGNKGPARAPVQGTITLDGQPLQNALVRFVPQAPTTGPAAMTSVEEGKFELPLKYGPLVGSHRVEIVRCELEPDPEDVEAVQKYLAERKKRKRVPGIPARYNEQSSLSAEVSAKGPNEFQFDLVSKL